MKKFLAYLKGRPLGMVSLVLLVILYILMIFAEFFAPYAPTASFGEMTYHPPNARFYQGKLQAQEFRVTSTVSWNYVRIRGSYDEIRFFAKGAPYKLMGLIPMSRHLFTTSGRHPVFLMGADNLGRDIFSRILYGSRISLTIGFVATAISLVLAVLFGGLSGYFGGAADWSIMRLCEFFMLIPGLYLILFLRSLLSSKMDTGQAYMMITIILSLVGWPGSARTIRGMVHAIKREEFVMNSQLEMIPPGAIIARDILPQIASLLIVSIALSIPGFIMTETTLSYLGLGIVDPAVSWGSMIKRDISTLSNLRNYPWLLTPVWFLLGVTLAFNFLGDCLRDYYDPYHTVFRAFNFFNLFKKTGAGAKAPETEQAGSAEAPEAETKALAREAPLLELKELGVTFSVLRGRTRVAVHAVRGVSFSLGKGEVLGIVGESGSGKSVTTQAVPGLLPGNAAVSGSVLYEGKELLGLPVGVLREYRGKKIGMIFQEPGRSYDPLQNIGSVFFETFRNSDPAITRRAAMDKAEALLKETGLDSGMERLSNFPHQFSGGQLQRIGIALALAQGCELLIADEPTTALDVTIQKQILELLKTLRRTRRISIIFISHDIDLVADISDRIMVMYGGLIMETGASATIASGGALHPYTKALLAASPAFGSHYSETRLQVIPGRVADPASPEPGCPFAPRCSLAQETCRLGIPPLKPAGEGHELRCVL
ncbi:MAG: dipeptide/oligopeptide/nickel ABC transporter permease/ATP-binding protein [Treponema sp.]|jgi:peptide/nickel transport system permease protein|nr:dipeptide/oligopeptide/nickel ABC transporter permease/ATP-binding protein [Treponema sp.]